MSAVRHDAGKTRYHHIHPDVLVKTFGRDILTDDMVLWFYFLSVPARPDLSNIKMYEVLDFGAKKYASLNYAKGMLYSRVFNSYMRHMYEAEGELDQESGLPHSAHAACNKLFAYTYHILGYDNGKFDDRPKDLV